MMILTETSAARRTPARQLQRRPIGQHRQRLLAIAPAHIAAIKAASPIGEVIGQHVELRRQGASFCGRCPWHLSKSGRSLRVSDEHGTYRCFAGCGSGDVIAFIMKFLGVSFSDAVVYLARRAGIDLSRPPSQELTRAVELRAAETRERERVDEAVLGELRRLGGELSDACRLHLAAGDRLALIERGAPLRFQDEAAVCWDAMALAQKEIRDLDAGYCCVGFGKADLRDRFVAHPEDRPAIIADVLEAGFVVTEKGFRHRVGIQ